MNKGYFSNQLIRWMYFLAKTSSDRVEVENKETTFANPRALTELIQFWQKAKDLGIVDKYEVVDKKSLVVTMSKENREKALQLCEEYIASYRKEELSVSGFVNFFAYSYVRQPVIKWIKGWLLTKPATGVLIRATDLGAIIWETLPDVTRTRNDYDRICNALAAQTRFLETLIALESEKVIEITSLKEDLVQFNVKSPELLSSKVMLPEDAIRVFDGEASENDVVYRLLLKETGDICINNIIVAHLGTEYCHYLKQIYDCSPQSKLINEIKDNGVDGKEKISSIQFEDVMKEVGVTHMARNLFFTKENGAVTIRKQVTVSDVNKFLCANPGESNLLTMKKKGGLS